MIEEKKIKRKKTHQSSTVVRTIPIMRRYLLQERVKCIDEEKPFEIPLTWVIHIWWLFYNKSDFF